MVLNVLFSLFLSILVKESVATGETEEAHIERDLIVTAPLIKSPGYRLQDDDPAIFSDGDDLDKFVPEREWPDEALPSLPQPTPQPAPQHRYAPDPQVLLLLKPLSRTC